MIRLALSRYGYQASLALLAVSIVVVGGFLLLVAVPDLVGLTADGPQPTPSASASPGSAMGRSPIGIAMPPDANCNACHLTDSGTVGTKPIPELGHPLWGFRDCTACHASEGLVKTAPGHSSLHKTDCLVCHRVSDALVAGTSIAPMRPEHMGGDKPCVSCHGIDKHAPLPENMKGRDSCWICHNGKEFTHLFESPSPAPTPQAPSPQAP